MFGTIRAFEGCELYREAIENYDDFRYWYKNMSNLVESSEGSKQAEILRNKEKPAEELIEIIDQDISDIKTIVQDKTADLLVLRILSLTYLMHMFVFSVASLCKST